MIFHEILEKGDISALRNIPKSDYHNHGLYGGNRIHLYHETGILIPPISRQISSIEDIDRHINRYTEEFCMSNVDYYSLLLNASLQQACWDGVKKLMISIDAWAIYHLYHGDVEQILRILNTSRIDHDIQLFLQVGISRFASLEEMEIWLEPLWNCKNIISIDLYGPEFLGNINDYKMIYNKAKKMGWLRIAHIGEWSNADMVITYIKELDLQHINHGLSIITSDEAIHMVKDRHIVLHQCPTSNYFLGRVNSIKNHPLGDLHRKGVLVTVNSDDILAFDSNVSTEYMKLYQAQVCSAEELNEIRERALSLL